MNLNIHDITDFKKEREKKRKSHIYGKLDIFNTNLVKIQEAVAVWVCFWVIYSAELYIGFFASTLPFLSLWLCSIT